MEDFKSPHVKVGVASSGRCAKRSAWRHDRKTEIASVVPITRAGDAPCAASSAARAQRGCRSVWSKYRRGEQHLHDAQIGAVVEQMRGEGVPQRVGRERFAGERCPARFLIRCQNAAASWGPRPVTNT